MPLNAPPAPPRTVAIDGLQFEIDALDSLGLGGGADFEPEIRAALERWVRPGDTVADIGANIGYFTARLARAVGAQGVVHAFEPEPSNFALLEGNLRRNGLRQVRLHAIALGAEPGRAELHTSEFNGGMHRLYDSVCCSGPALAVAVERLDDVLAGVELDLIKIDVEGYEPQVLAGARACLRASPHLKIVSEYCVPSMLEAGTSPSAMLRELQQLGYAPHELDGRPLAIGALLDDAQRYERYGRARIVDACAGRTPAQIVAVVERLAAELGCRRPYIENLLFMRAG
jgi:FkbM family methyltransferase